MTTLSEDLSGKSWYGDHASRDDAETFLNQCVPGRFMVRPSSQPGCLALSHRLPNGEIGHALIQGGATGWHITGSEKMFPTVESLLRSRQLKFPAAGDFGSPNKREGGAATATAAADASRNGHVAGSGDSAQRASNPSVSSTPPVPFDNTEALEKVLACLVNPNMTQLELFSMNLSSLPSEVKDLVQLKLLYLSDNNFKQLPTEVYSLRNLRTLWLAGNQLTRLPPELAQLKQLQKLKLTQNKIDAVDGLPAEMASMTSLSEIWLDNNNLEVFPPVLLTVTSLEHLTLDNNQIQTIPDAIGNLKRLHRLSMARNLVAELPATIGECAELKKLTLRECRLTTVPASLARCTKLTVVALQQNSITKMPDLSMLYDLDLKLEGNPLSADSVFAGSSDEAASGSGGANSSSLAGSGTAAGANGTLKRKGAPPLSDRKVSAVFPFPKFKKSKSTANSETARQNAIDLHAAIQTHEIKTIKRILTKKRKQGGLDFSVLHDNMTPLTAAVRKGNYDVVKLIVPVLSAAELNQKDTYGYTALHHAVCDASDQIIEELVKAPDIDVNVANNDHNTPLHYFCEKNHSPDCEKIGQLLIERGAKVNERNNNGETPLHKAIFNSSVRLMMVRLLIKNGADVNLRATKSETPLHYAVYWRREDLVTMLLKAGADMSICTHDNRRPYEVAVIDKSQRIAELLKKCEDLMAFLKRIDMQQYFVNFMREEIFLNVLGDVSDEMLEKKVGITASGHRLAIRKAIETSGGKSTGQLPQIEQPPDEIPINVDIDLDRMNLKEGERIKFEDLELLRELGSGAGGKVFEAMLKTKNGGVKVAVKVLNKLKDGGEVEDFKKELEVMTAIRDPYMVFFYGVCLEPSMCMVMEFCGRGSLFHVLNKEGLRLGWKQVIEWAAQASGGTACLHKHGIVHRDIKTLNLLVTEQWVIKVCDFGLARFNNEGNLQTLNKMRGTMAYCPPEAYFAQPFTPASDVYSLAVVVWELANRVCKGKYEAPYSEFPNLVMDFMIIIQVAKNHLRPTIPEGCPEELSALITRTWDFDAEKRPTAEGLRESLKTLLNTYENNKKTWDAVVAPVKEASK